MKCLYFASAREGVPYTWHMPTSLVGQSVRDLSIVSIVTLFPATFLSFITLAHSADSSLYVVFSQPRM